MKKENVSQLIKSGLRSVLASFPIAASISQAWNEYESHLQQARVNKFFEDFATRLEHLEKHINKEVTIDANEVSSLLEKTVDAVRKEPDDYKRHSFSVLLSNCIVEDSNIEFGEKYNLLDLLETLNIKDIRLLRQFLREGNLRVETMGNFFDSHWTEEKDRLFGELIFSLSKLEARGLISQTEDNINMKAWSGSQENWINRWKFKHYEILPYGRLLLKLLDETKI